MTLILFPRLARERRSRRFRFFDEVGIAGECRSARVIGTRATLAHVPEALCLRADGTMDWIPERTLRAPVVAFARRAA